MNRIRPPAVAGTFYPGERNELVTMVTRQLEHAAAESHDHPEAPKAVIAPHAGFIYSGAIAAAAFTTLLPAAESISRVVLLGPSHHFPLRDLALSGADAFDTPLGPVPVDREAVEQLALQSGARVQDKVHAPEHALETHLPFLQQVLTGFSIVPILVGDLPKEEVSQMLRSVWGGPETVISVSSDLSHFLPYEQAVTMDRETSEAIVAQDAERLTPGRACGCYAVKGLLQASLEMDLNPVILDACNSGDTAGTKDQVVGYGAYAFYE